MDTSSFDVQIRNLQTRMDAIRIKMEEGCKDFLEATKEFIITWFQNYAEKEVISHPEIAKKLGEKELHKLKSDLKNLIVKAADLVDKHVNTDKYWAHRGQLPDEPPNPFGRYHVYGRRAPDELDNGVRELLGYIGGILIKYGFANTGQHSEWEIKQNLEEPRFRYGYDWSEKMNSIIKRYSDLYDELIKLDSELKKLIREKAELEAKDLWDRA